VKRRSERKGRRRTSLASSSDPANLRSVPPCFGTIDLTIDVASAIIYRATSMRSRRYVSIRPPRRRAREVKEGRSSLTPGDPCSLRKSASLSVKTLSVSLAWLTARIISVSMSSTHWIGTPVLRISIEKDAYRRSRQSRGVR
jgi:hypothetical protein